MNIASAGIVAPMYANMVNTVRIFRRDFTPSRVTNRWTSFGLAGGITHITNISLFVDNTTSQGNLQATAAYEDASFVIQNHLAELWSVTDERRTLNINPDIRVKGPGFISGNVYNTTASPLTVTVSVIGHTV